MNPFPNRFIELLQQPYFFGFENINLLGYILWDIVKMTQGQNLNWECHLGQGI